MHPVTFPQITVLWLLHSQSLPDGGATQLHLGPPASTGQTQDLSSQAQPGQGPLLEVALMFTMCPGAFRRRSRPGRREDQAAPRPHPWHSGTW